MDATRVGALHIEHEAFDADAFAALGHVPEHVQHVATDGVVLVGRTLRAEVFAEVLGARQRTDLIVTFVLLEALRTFGSVVLIFDPVVELFSPALARAQAGPPPLSVAPPYIA